MPARSTKHSLKFINKGKQTQITGFISRYREMVKKYINILWENRFQKIPSLIESEVCNQIATHVNFDSRIRQCAAKQACSMVKAVMDKQNKRLHKLKELQKEGKDTKYLQSKIDRIQGQKPNFKKINVELDPRFIDIQNTEGYFDVFVQVSQIGNKEIIRIPIKHTKVSQKWLSEGNLKSSIRLNNGYLTLYYEIQKKESKGTKIVGADQGVTTCLSLSDGQITKKNKDGYDLQSITKILARRKKGSIGFRKAQEHRKNYINWSLNQNDYNNIKRINFEKICDLRRGKKSSRYLSHWTYPLIKQKLIRLAEDKGFVLNEQSNKYRSQRCSQCGWTYKLNRLGKTFKCTNRVCGFFTDADLNAAFNHEIELIEIPRSVWYERRNRTTGFFWLVDCVLDRDQEPIVLDVQKA